ncbi:fimbrial protein [Paenalcaligenes suwonensis]|uniref:fimbrial protein n=1 Tax=Paenalcaligenes suwonensis TaxID=1202713 RepID=UPI00140AEECB|nr:fimbrial protein [Paenalcaligenes suwonensis]NHC62064.1 fimbrial protein [Paenalcaligenes suwonensis]
MRITPASFGVLALGSSLLFSATAFAAPSGCIDNIGTSEYMAYQPALLNVTFQTGAVSQVVVPADATVGTVLHTVENFSFPDLNSMDYYSAARYVAYANCLPGRIENFRVMGQESPLAGVYRLQGTDNIGYRVNYPGLPSSRLAPISFIAGLGNEGTTAYPGQGGVNEFFLYPPVGTMRVEYVLISTTWPASRQVTISGQLARVDVDGVGAGSLLRYNPNQVRFIPEPCSFTSNKVINLTLPPVDSYQFTGSGTKLETTDVPLLQMRCSNVSGTPEIRITGTADPSNITGVLKNIAPSDAATGVGILLEHKPDAGQPFPADITGGPENSALALVDAGSCGSNCRNWNLPLRASYYSTSDTVNSGLVHAQATVLVQYP